MNTSSNNSNFASLLETHIFPVTTRIGRNHHLIIGGCDLVDLAGTYGTPLYIFDEATIRQKCTEFLTEFRNRYPDTTVIYAGKTFLNYAMAALLKWEGMGLDVCSAGEVNIAITVQFSREKIYFHGNNKTVAELDMALDNSIGQVVVDNLYELDLLDSLAKKRGKKQDIMLRIGPGIDPHTHKYTSTGIIDSKFGFPMITGQAEDAVMQAMAAQNLNLIGLHCHLGSPIFEMEPYQRAIEATLKFAADMKRKHNLRVQKYSPGGGFAIQYTRDNPAPSISVYAETITSTLINNCHQLGLDLPGLIIEPGRSIAGQAGVAIYTVGATKDIPGVRKYVLVDGGMCDNIRQALYGAKYEALIANKADAKTEEKITISGRACESGDILIKDIDLPILSSGDIIAIPDCGAYCIPMSSNYNMFPRPAIVMVNSGKARIIRRRETIQDMVNRDIL